MTEEEIRRLKASIEQQINELKTKLKAGNLHDDEWKSIQEQINNLGNQLHDVSLLQPEKKDNFQRALFGQKAEIQFSDDQFASELGIKKPRGVN